MAVVVPLIAAYSSMAAIAAGTATVMSYVAVAGAVMQTAGMITKDKNLTKFGSILSIAGAVGNLATSLSTAGEVGASSVANGSAAADFAGHSIDEATAAAQDAAWRSAAEEAANSAVTQASTDAAAQGAYAGGGDGANTLAAKEAAKEATIEGAKEAGKSVAETVAEEAAEEATGAGAKLGFDPLSTAAEAATDAASVGDSGSSIFEKTFMDGGQADIASKVESIDKLGDFKLGQDLVKAPNSLPANAIKEGAANLTWDDIKAGLGKTSEFLSKNKELVKIGGSILGSVYGKDAEMLDLQKEQQARRLRNLNSPIRLGQIGVRG